MATAFASGKTRKNIKHVEVVKQKGIIERDAIFKDYVQDGRLSRWLHW